MTLVSTFTGWPRSCIEPSSQITATTAQGFAEIRILSASDLVTALPSGEVTTEGNRRALLNFLGQATLAIQDGRLTKAIDKLEKSIERCDGCSLRGAPDGDGPGRDWLTSCGSQSAVFDLLSDALAALTP